MSQQVIGDVIDRLLSDEDLRFLLTVDRFEALGELCTLGFELTPSEIDLFIESNLETWHWRDRAIAVRTH
jgi:hypothetical protein